MKTKLDQQEHGGSYLQPEVVLLSKGVGGSPLPPYMMLRLPSLKRLEVSRQEAKLC